MKSSKNTIHQLVSKLLSCISNLRSIFSFQKFLNGLHYHFSVRFILILQTEMNPLNNLSNSDFYSDLSCCFNQLLIISFFCCHSSGPKTSEIIIKNLFSNVGRLNSVATYDLLENFEDYFSHLLLRGFKLPD